MTPEGRTERLLEAIASKEPAPASGSAAAAVAAMGAALLEKVARLSVKQMGTQAVADRERAHALRLHGEELIEADVQAYLGYVAARRSGQGLAEMHSATIDVPARIGRVAAEIVELAERLAVQGNPNLRADAVAAAIFGQAALSCVAMLTSVNSSGDRARTDARVRETARLFRAASASVRRLASPARGDGRDRARARSAGSPLPSPRRSARGGRSASRPARRAP